MVLHPDLVQSSGVKEFMVPFGEFKGKCLRLLRAVEKGTRIVITRCRRPVAETTPPSSAKPRLRGAWKDSVKVAGDIVYFDTSDEWESGQD